MCSKVTFSPKIIRQYDKGMSEGLTAEIDLLLFLTPLEFEPPTFLNEARQATIALRAIVA